MHVLSPYQLPWRHRLLTIRRQNRHQIRPNSTSRWSPSGMFLEME